MRSTRRQDIADFVEAWTRKRYFLAGAYARLMGKKVGLKKEAFA